MKGIAVVIIATSAAMMIAISLGAIIWMISSVTSYPVGKAIFIALWTIVFVSIAAYLGLRLSSGMSRRNREYMEQHRKKQ
jgi:hypothetical protein